MKKYLAVLVVFSLASISFTLPTFDVNAQIDSACTPIWTRPNITTVSDDAVPYITSAAQMPNGMVVMGGHFRLPSNNVLMWDPTNDTTTTMGQGLNGVVNRMLTMPDGSVVAGGDFPEHVARWNGTSWVQLGDDVGDSVRAMALMPDGSLIVGTQTTVKRWNGTTWTTLPGQSGNGINTLYVDPAGTLYVGENGGAVGNSSIAKWNGSTWETVGAETIYGVVKAISSLSTGDLIIGGHQIAISGIDDITQIGRRVTAALHDGHWGPVATVALNPYPGQPNDIPKIYTFLPRNSKTMLVGGYFVNIDLEPGTNWIADLKFGGGAWRYHGINPILPQPPTINSSGPIIGAPLQFLKLADGRILLVGVMGQLILPNTDTGPYGSANGPKALTVYLYKSADFNCSRTLDTQDIFSFLQGWFAGDSRTDFNLDRTITSQDIFGFLQAWFASE